MTSNDWQERVLTDAELQVTLAKLGALDAMQVLQRQLELRSAQHSQAPVLRDEVSNHLELGLTDVVPIAEPFDPLVEPVAIEVDPPVAPITAPVEPAAVTNNPQADIAANLNALFSSRQHVNFEAKPPLELKPVEPKFDYAPIPLESDTKSFFIPTFANPLPDTQSIEVVTPIAQHGTDTETPKNQLSPAVESPETSLPQPLQLDVTELPSAEEAVTAYEEAGTTSTPQPTLVDEVILEVGGEPVDFDLVTPTAEVPEVAPQVVEDSLPIAIPVNPDTARVPELQAKPIRETETVTGRSAFGALIATWNGTGNLLFLIAAGFTAAALHFNLISTLAGAFGAMAAAGFGFGTAALSARRGRQPQATISRAAFGVRGAIAPLALVLIAKYAATAVAAIATAFAVIWFFPGLPTLLKVGGFTLDIFAVVLTALLIVATVVTIMGAAARFLVTAVVAGTTIAWVLSIAATAAVVHPVTIGLGGGVQAGNALTLASVLFILVSIVWGTTAADETPNLRSDIVAPKLIAAGLLSHAFIGTLAVFAGFAFYSIDVPVLKGPFFGAVFAILAVLALSHQIRRSADSFSGFGLRGTRWWVVVGSSVLVAVAGIFAHLFIADNDLKAAAISLLPVAGVPVVSWLAIYGVDSILRREDYHEISLLRDYGFYGRVRLMNLAGWTVALIIGLGFVQSNVAAFTWLGYLARPLGLSTAGTPASTGVWIAFFIGLITPLLTIRQIQEQEAEGRALQERHKELINVLGEL